ncbi:hypothetical protein NKI96_21185 [Mesorhizobium sp. M0292]|uniref:hypothetical protein n=1 Tax=Mesorhizobium sp. M0292 TaxID=2956929 RepID=UPI00333C753D
MKLQIAPLTTTRLKKRQLPFSRSASIIPHRSRAYRITLPSIAFAATKIIRELGSGLIDYSQKMPVAAIQIAEKKVWGASVVAGGDAAPVLELGEQVLDLVALAEECPVVVVGNFAASA